MIFEILQELASDNSRNFKLEVLEREKDNALLKRVISLALDPFTQFYIRKIPKYTPAEPEQADSLDSVLSSLSMLSTRQVTGNAAIEYLTKLLSSLSEDDANVLERVIKKDLKCGVAASSVNKVWSDMVTEYPCMLCSAYDEKAVANINFPAIVQLKLDGMRFNAVVSEGDVEIRSRNGKKIDLKGRLNTQFLKLANKFSNPNMVFDGELIVTNPKGEILDRQTGNGILNKAVKGTISDQEADMVIAVLWDAIPFNNFASGSFQVGYGKRFAELGGNYVRYKRENVKDKIRLVASSVVDSLESAQSIFQMYLGDGQEGIILKDERGFWENKRVKHQVKFKGEFECDLEVVDYEEGTGKYAGKLGALVLGSRQSDKDPIVVSVGSGFTDADRDRLWSNIDDVVGKIVAVKYNSVIKNKSGGTSLFLPIFVEIREDKTEADSVEDIV